MTFWNRMSPSAQPPAAPTEAAMACGVAALTYSGPFTDLERRILSIFRDQFPPFSRLPEAAFQQTMENAINLVQQQGLAQDIGRFIQSYAAPALGSPDDRLGAYRYSYAMAMVNLNVDAGEEAFLMAVKTGLNLDPVSSQNAERAVLDEFAVLHRALASAILGLIVIAADGQIKQEELDDLKADRGLLETVAKLDDEQFTLVYDMAVSIYNRFLMDASNRRIFLYNIIVPRLDTRDLKNQAFQYCASISTADGDVSRAEIDTMKDILTALGLSDAAGEAIFGQFMARVRTIDGQPVQ